jgi:hypothetical protein
MSHEGMKASTARRRNMKHDPDVYGFHGETIGRLREALGRANGREGARLLVRLGRRDDGSPEAWLEVKVGDESLGAYNVSFNCPPWPPEYCAE